MFIICSGPSWIWSSLTDLCVELSLCIYLLYTIDCFLFLDDCHNLKGVEIRERSLLSTSLPRTFPVLVSCTPLPPFLSVFYTLITRESGYNARHHYGLLITHNSSLHPFLFNCNQHSNHDLQTYRYISKTIRIQESRLKYHLKYIRQLINN